MPKSVTHEELIAAIRAAGFTGGASDEGMTTAELAAAWGVCRQIAEKRLREAMEAGFLRRGRAMRERFSGVIAKTNVYTFVLPTAKGGKKK